jgi:hypothetical protein
MTAVLVLLKSLSKVSGSATRAVPLQQFDENRVLTIAYKSRGPCQGGISPRTCPNSHTPLLHEAAEWVGL